MAEGWMGWQRGRTIMADLQDTNAATEEIYGPLFIVDCPVTRRDDFSKPRRTDSGQSEAKLFPHIPAHHLWIMFLDWGHFEGEQPGKSNAARKHEKDERTQARRGQRGTVKANQGREKKRGRGCLHGRQRKSLNFQVECIRGSRDLTSNKLPLHMMSSD